MIIEFNEFIGRHSVNQAQTLVIEIKRLGIVDFKRKMYLSHTKTIAPGDI